MDCTRCESALRAPDPVETGEVAHRCVGCGGEWVEGRYVEVAFPALRHHARRIGELMDLGAHRRGASCPRCDEPMVEFPFFDLWLDLCDRCHGMWVDGDEAGFVRKAAKTEDGLPERRDGGGYRDAAATVDHERVGCTECFKHVHPRRTFLTAEGPVCDDCVETEALGAALREQSGLKPLAQRARRVLAWLGKLADAHGKKERINVRR